MLSFNTQYQIRLSRNFRLSSVSVSQRHCHRKEYYLHYLPPYDLNPSKCNNVFFTCQKFKRGRSSTCKKPTFSGEGIVNKVSKNRLIKKFRKTNNRIKHPLLLGEGWGHTIPTNVVLITNTNPCSSTCKKPTFLRVSIKFLKIALSKNSGELNSYNTDKRCANNEHKSSNCF